jgi:hypothetical protein
MKAVKPLYRRCEAYGISIWKEQVRKKKGDECLKKAVLME